MITNRIPNKSDYEFTSSELLSLDLHSPAFRELLNCGGYIYTNRHLCLNVKECYTEKDGRYVFDHTFIENHLSEYCLSSQTRFLTYFRHVKAMRHPADIIPAQKQTARSAQEADRLFEQIELTQKDLARKSSPAGQPPHVSFYELFQYHRKAQGLTQEQLSELSGVSVRSISRMEHDEQERHKLNHVIACIVAMHLEWDESSRLVELAGYHWRDYNNLDHTYKRILRCHYQNPVGAINDYLQRLGYLPLSTGETIP